MIRPVPKTLSDLDAQESAILAMRRRGMLTPTGEIWADRDLAEIRRQKAIVKVGGGL